MGPQAESWYAFEQGATIGTQGSEYGLIVLDEEYSDATRISLERETQVAPFAITCGIYGCMMHTRYFDTEPEARRQYEAMKVVLKQTVDGFDSQNVQVRDDVREVLGAFAERFPTLTVG